MSSLFSVSRLLAKGKKSSLKRSFTSKSKTLDALEASTDTQPPTRAGSPLPVLLADTSSVSSRKGTTETQGGLPTPPPTAAAFTSEPADIPDDITASTPPSLPAIAPSPAPAVAPTLPSSPPPEPAAPPAPDFGLPAEPTSTSGRPPSFVIPNDVQPDAKMPLDTSTPPSVPTAPASESDWTQVESHTPPTPPPEPVRLETKVVNDSPLDRPPTQPTRESSSEMVHLESHNDVVLEARLQELEARHQDEVRQLEELKATHAEEIRKLHEEASHQQERIRQLQAENSHQQNEHQQRESQSAEKIHKLEERIVEVNGRLQETADTAKRTLERSLLDLRTKLDARHAEKEEALRALRSEFADERTTKEKRIKDLDNSLKKANEELASQKAFVIQLTGRVEQRDAAISDLENQKSSLRRDTEEEHKELLNEIRRLNEVLTEEHNSARLAAQRAEKEEERLTEEVDQRGEEIKRLSDQVAHLQAENQGLRDMLGRSNSRVVPGKSDAEAKLLGAELVKAEEKLAGIAREKRTLMEHIEAQAERLQQYQNQMISGSAMRDLYRVWTAPFAEFIKNVLGERVTPPTNASSAGVPLQPLIVNGTPAQDARLEEAVNLTKSLNEEVYQLSASLADHIDAFDPTSSTGTDASRFVSASSAGTSGSQPSLVRLSPTSHSTSPLVDAAATALKPILGHSLVSTLLQEATQPQEEMNPFYLQTALQGVLIACMCQTIRSWYPAESEYGTFLLGIYERLRGMAGWKTANYWRFFALQATTVPGQVDPLQARFVSQLEEQIFRVLLVAGWSQPSSSSPSSTPSNAFLPPLVNSKLALIASLLIRLHTVIHTSPDFLGQIEPRIVLPGDRFWSNTMCDDNAFDDLEDDGDSEDEPLMASVGSSSSRTITPSKNSKSRNGNGSGTYPPGAGSGSHFNEPVICTVGLGLDYARENQQQPPQRPLLGQPASRPSAAGFARIHEMLLKPRVVLHNALYDD